MAGSVAAAAAPFSAARAAPPSPAGQQAPGGAVQPQPAAPAEQGAKSEAGGIVQLVDQALAGIALSPEQTAALQKLAADVDAHMAALDKARQDYVMDLAQQVESGQFDEAALQGDIQRIDAAAEAASPGLRAAFQKMHDTLSADQRKEFVAHFRDLLAKQASDTKSQLDEWSRTLKLTDDQKQKIAAILEEDRSISDDFRARIEKMLDAFPADSFSLDQTLPAESLKDRAEKMEHRIFAMAQKVSELLTAEQRAIAAKALRERAKTGQTTARDSIAPEEGTTGTASEALWAGGARYTATSYRAGAWGGYGFRRSYATGYGGVWLF